MTSARARRAEGVHVAPFRCDVTPPPGHPLCGGWIAPAVDVDDALEAIGFLLLGAGDPIVVCAVDWTGILNETHARWRRALAEAAGTTPDRVALHCVHQHNAPFACAETHAIVSAHPDLPPVVQAGFLDEAIRRCQAALAAAPSRARRATHVSHGSARVDRVASSRRIVGPDGKLAGWRSSSTRDPALRDLPEGLIDPCLRTVGFHDGGELLVACHYYATHPMSYYGDGRVSSDFAGLARKRLQEAEPETTHIYFTGCAGNVAAGKYNEGSPASRRELTDRVADALRRSRESAASVPLTQVGWRTIEIAPPPHPDWSEAELLEQVADSSLGDAERNRAAFKIVWQRRLSRGGRLLLSALELDGIRVLHLPSECFVEYQLFAQSLAAGGFVAVAAYGDGGPWYIPTRAAYGQGGYEVSVAFSAPDIEAVLHDGIRALLGS